MGSFKLEKSKGAKKEARGAGALLIALGAVTFVLVDGGIGALFGLIGFVLLLAGFTATE